MYYSLLLRNPTFTALPPTAAMMLGGSAACSCTRRILAGVLAQACEA